MYKTQNALCSVTIVGGSAAENVRLLITMTGKYCQVHSYSFYSGVGHNLKNASPTLDSWWPEPVPYVKNVEGERENKILLL